MWSSTRASLCSSRCCSCDVRSSASHASRASAAAMAASTCGAARQVGGRRGRRVEGEGWAMHSGDGGRSTPDGMRSHHAAASPAHTHLRVAGALQRRRLGGVHLRRHLVLRGGDERQNLRAGASGGGVIMRAKSGEGGWMRPVVRAARPPQSVAPRPEVRTSWLSARSPVVAVMPTHEPPRHQSSLPAATCTSCARERGRGEESRRADNDERHCAG